MQLDNLISQIQSVDGALRQEANRSVNRLLTIRNWLIGYYIVEYEQKGEDRAKYGENLLDTLAEKININGLSGRNLKLFKQFYIYYPSIVQTPSAQLNIATNQIHQMPSDEFKLQNYLIEIVQALSAQFENFDNKSVIKKNEPIAAFEAILNEKIISALSFSHIALLLPLNDPFKRAFYPIEPIKGTWSVRELKRQVSSLLFERSGISKKPELLLQSLDKKAEKEHSPRFQPWVN